MYSKEGLRIEENAYKHCPFKNAFTQCQTIQIPVVISIEQRKSL